MAIDKRNTEEKNPLDTHYEHLNNYTNIADPRTAVNDKKSTSFIVPEKLF